MAKIENLKWVFQLLKSFCKLVGFPIVKHEAQCVALFHLLEQECIDLRNDGEPKRPAYSRKKGLRELRGACFHSEL